MSGIIIRRNSRQISVAKLVSERYFGHPEHMAIAWLMGKIQEPFVGQVRADEANDEYRELCAAFGTKPDTRWTDA